MTIKPLFDAWRDYVMDRPEPVVQEWFADFDWNLPEQEMPANNLHAVRHVPDCEPYSGKRESTLVRTFIGHVKKINWLQMWGPEHFGQYFVDNYCHMQLIGPEGHFQSDKIAGGIVMYGPNTHYPNHWHEALEIYIPLTGNGLWSKDNGDYVLREAGEFIFHDSNMSHAIKAEETPLLALWIWHDGDLTVRADY